MASTTKENQAASPSISMGQERTDGVGDGESEDAEPLVHPVPSMQGAFEESILESTEENEVPVSPMELDAQSRRHQLLECKQYDDSWIARWKQSPTAQYHPLLKLMAQIVFGMHLLQQRQAKSEKEVVKILQTHVNEVDTFLENTSEDFNVALKDIDDRIRYLKLPMAHMDVFETMLDDKKFRTQLLEGNEKIEKIIERTTRAMNAALLDVEKGAQANKELGRYMKSVQNSWPQAQRGIWDVFVAMRGNEQGWRRYLRDLQSKATTLARILAQLHRLIGNMSRMAAAASRRNKTQSSTVVPEAKSATSTPGPRSKFSQEPQPTLPAQSPQRNLNKPLPKEPQAVLGVTQDSSPMPHPVPFPDRYEQPRQTPPGPSTPPRTSAVSSLPRTRPKTAGEARAADARSNPSELLDFFQRPDPLRSNPNPLRSNPPDESSDQQDILSVPQRLGRSQSHGTNVMLSAVGARDDVVKVTRSRSQGAIDILTITPSTNLEKSPTTPKLSLDASRVLSGDKKIEEPIRPSLDDVEKRAAMKG